MKVFVKESKFMPRGGFLDFGWGNGYVVIPKGHSLHGKSYNEIHELIDSLEINGGLIFDSPANELKWDELPEGSQDGWVVGFDTAHSWDTLEKWDKKAVMEEAKRLKEQLLRYSFLRKIITRTIKNH